MPMRCAVLAVCALLCAAGCSVNPWRKQDEKREQDVPPREVRVEVFADGMMLFQGARLPLAALGRALRRVKEEIGAEGVRVVVVPSEDAPYRLVSDAVGASRAAGFSDVILWPEPAPSR